MGDHEYRLTQVLDWLYARRVNDWQEMTNVPKGLREKLGNQYALNCLELVRKQGSWDSTQKFLWRLKDHALIESVLIPASPALYGEPNDRHTLCVSTQVGCAHSDASRFGLSVQVAVTGVPVLILPSETCTPGVPLLAPLIVVCAI